MMIIALLVVGGFAFYVMTSEERVRAMKPAFRFLRDGLAAAMRGRAGVRFFAHAVYARRPWAVASLGAVVALMIAASVHAVWVKGLTDIRPDIERLIAVEQQTSGAYEKAVAQFRLGALSAEALARVIHGTVMPELQAVRLRLKSLDRVPDEHRPVLAQADEYLRLRDESWRLRAAALEKRSMAALKQADRAERTSLEAFDRVRVPEVSR
jgi:hypothetical protein